MYWGAGPGLGLLTLLGYVAFSIGAALLWRKRNDFSVWAHDEFGDLQSHNTDLDNWSGHY